VRLKKTRGSFFYYHHYDLKKGFKPIILFQGPVQTALRSALTSPPPNTSLVTVRRALSLKTQTHTKNAEKGMDLKLWPVTGPRPLFCVAW